MPEHLRALIVILALAIVVFTFARVPACAMAITPKDFGRRRNLWLAITLTAFLSHDFWVFIAVTATLLLIALQRESNKFAMYFFLLLVVPPIAQRISGLGIINYFFEIHYIRLLSFVILLPAFWILKTRSDVAPFGKSLSDKLIAGYIILLFGLTLTVSSFTDTLRTAVFYPFLDIFLPYYVASRSVKNVQDFRDVLMAFVVTALVMSAIGAFEAVRHWLLYSSLAEAQGINWSWGNYLEREGAGLRAQVSAGQPIVFGYVIAVAFGFFLYLQKSISNTWLRSLGLVTLAAGLSASLSRGPWVGAVVMLLVFIATGEFPIQRLFKISFLIAVGALAMLATPFGDKIIDLLPFIGTVEDVNVTYRTRLLEIGINFILQNPLFGAYDFFLSAEAQELKQGEGIIDLVNTFLAIGLSSGLVGLTLFSGFFASIAFDIFRAMRGMTKKENDLHLLGQALFSTLIGILVIIFTVSSVLAIPVIYWSVSGLCLAYVHMLSSVKTQ